jgi:sporulation protein YlmC with PRC-barrel domain
MPRATVSPTAGARSFRKRVLAPDDTHLRSAEELFGYRVQATDGRIGRVDDFIVDDETWDVRYLVVETSAWWFGKSVLIAPTWARRMIWTTGLLGS